MQTWHGGYSSLEPIHVPVYPLPTGPVPVYEMEREESEELVGFKPRRRLAVCCLATSCCLSCVLLAVVVATVLHDGGHSGAESRSGFAARAAPASGHDTHFSLPIMPPGIGCDNLNATCICGEETTGAYACYQWLYEVGDVVFMGAPKMVNFEAALDRLVMAFTASDQIHVGVVVGVPPAGLRQTPENIEISEAVGDRVSNGTLRYLVERYDWGSVHVLRVDGSRFPKFREQHEHLSVWAKQRIGEPFSRFLLVYGLNDLDRAQTVLIDPDCNERHRALEMYRNGGPGAWFCSMYVAWVIGLAGGLNWDYGVKEDCTLPKWTVRNLQATPGDLYRMDIWDKTERVANCPKGCFMGWPQGIPEVVKTL